MENEKGYKSGIVRVTVSYGYDIHSIYFSGRTYARIKAGKPISLKGQGFRWDDVPDQDYWHFNKSSADSIYVNTDGGGDIFKGTFGDGDVWVETEDVS